MTQELPDARRLRWQCRRGLLELDVLFEAFLDNQYNTLDDVGKQAFVELLRQPDPLLQRWVMGFEAPADPRFTRLIERLRHL